VKHRKKILSNRSFAAIWDAASKAGSYRELCNMAYDSKYFNPSYLEKKSGLSMKEVYVVLENVYKAYNMRFDEIMKEAGTTNSKLRDSFCIPEKSIEAWKSGRNRCPDYIRLMLLRYYHLLKLGKYIYTEEYDNYLKTIPKVYEESEKEKANDAFNKKGAITINKAADDSLDSDIYDNVRNYEDYSDDDFYEMISSIGSAKHIADDGVNINNKRNSVVNKTDYLDNILKNRKKK
jgi:hypothetical protein